MQLRELREYSERRDLMKFWKLVRDQSEAAALACVEANHTLAGALVAFTLLRNIGGEENEDHAK